MFTRNVFAVLGIFLAVWALPVEAQNPAWNPPAGYYSTVNTTSGATLRTTLHSVIDDHTVFPYTASGTDTWNILEAADEDPGNSANVIDVYKNASYPKAGGGNLDYNREHRWPSSLGFPDEGIDAYTDCHGLAISNDGYNSARGNSPYGNCTAGCDPFVYPTDNNNGIGGFPAIQPNNSNYLSGGLWEVWIGRRGDVARALFYLDVRYEGDFGDPQLILTDNLALVQNTDASNGGTAYMGRLSDLISWHLEDPVDEYERRRNHVVFGFQGNRNPFVDHPEWVCILFNAGECSDSTPPAVPTGLAATAGNGAVLISWNANIEIDLQTYTLYRSTNSTTGFVAVASGLTALEYLDINVVNNTTYYYRLTALDFNNESAQTANVSATPNTSGPDFIAPSVPTGLAAEGVPGTSHTRLTWNANPEGDIAGYHLFKGPSSAGPFVQLGSLITGTTTTDASTAYDVASSYRITAQDTAGNRSGQSAIVEFTPRLLTNDPWINEFHYDNAGTDVEEFVEIAGPAGLNLTGWELVFYNGSTGATYSTVRPLSSALPSATIPDLGNCFGVVSLVFEQDALQNGSPDGIALVNPEGTVVEFLSYEGSFTATNRPAQGMTSTDVGVTETGTTPVGHSLQRAGVNGLEASDFTWQSPAANTRGSFNTGQTFASGCAEPPSTVTEWVVF
ncbi:MAG: endonuclease [Candidatus Sumerlaeia bacterium]|nr:endonuclease [Candidatus Sumerlaeia bacterium]